MRGRAGAVSAVIVLAVAAVAVLAFVLFRGAAAGPATPTDTSGSATSGPTSTSPTVAPVLSPFTGRPVRAAQPVLAVKIDNVRPARPQTGLDKADIVYVEPVEGGLSRILGIFSGTLPPRIGPVRSARESDLELLAQYGKPGLIYSGANKTVLSAIRKASVVDLSPNRVSSAYRRSSAKPAPHNLMVDPRRLVGRDGISDAKDIGFRFGTLPTGLGTPTPQKVIRYGAASTTFTWSAKRHLWDVSFDGRAATTDGVRLGASTVIIQYTKITSSTLHDVLGNATPYTHTVGSGTAVVLRDGVAVNARWSRPSAGVGTAFTTTTGAALPLATGQVWVVYAKSLSGQ
jgi:hypothetical protein